MARAEERGTAINNEILFVELEWAALADERADALLADDRLAFCRALPRVGAPLPAAPAERARGADPLRQVAHRQRRVGPAVLRAHVGDHRRLAASTARRHGRP